MSKQLFISYSHDSNEHAAKVLKFANLLRRYGYEVLIDQMNNAPEEGWPLWMNKGIKNADFVLVICTETYLKRLMQEEKEGLGFGCRFEGKVIYNIIYNHASRNSKFLPVLFEAEQQEFIPDLLSGDSFYVVNSAEPNSFEILKRRLDDQHRAFTAELGEHVPAASFPDPGDFFAYTPSTSNRAKIDLSAMPVTSGEIVGREQELMLLDQAWEAPKTRIISFIAWGGVGKSSLLNKWLEQMDNQDFKSAAQVFAHSFYSQGTSDQRQVSAEHFINQAFRFLDYAEQKPSSPHEQGVLLAELFSQRKTLLILDGLEPMQHPLGDLEGRLKEQSLVAFLKNLAFNLTGLCVITSRVPVYELKIQSCINHELERLGTEAGIDVLRNNKVKGPRKSLAKAVEEVEGHALTLALLGSYLKTVYQGDIDKRDQMPTLSGNRGTGKHAQKVMYSYHQWLAENAAPELDILHILGLFDRPATIDAINVLKAEPPITGVTERLRNLTAEEWAYAIDNLRALNLIAKTITKNSNFEEQDLDCHPLIREYFTQQLKDQNPLGFRSAHARLYEYYKKLPEKDLPDTLTELEPLFTAVAHGCLAGMYQQTLYEVYWPRIQRERENYIINKLGAFGIDLACVACFFERTWDLPAQELTDESKTFLLNWAGFGLRGFGRLTEAVAPFVASVERWIEQNDWKNAAKEASNTSELYLTLGKLTQAQQFGEQSVTYADYSKDDFLRMSLRTTWADALFQSGKLDQAKALFREAEAIQHDHEPNVEILYSLPGFRFCKLLLDSKDEDAVIARAKKSLTITTKNKSILGVALDELSAGKAHTQKAVEQDLTDFTQAESHLNQAVLKLRQVSHQEMLLLGLLAQSTLYSHQYRHQEAWQNLDEVFESASHSQMLLHLTDYHLEACRNIQQQLKNSADNFVIVENGKRLAPNKPAMQVHFTNHLNKAEKLINQTNYHRRDQTLLILKSKF